MMHTTTTTMTARDLAPFGQILPQARVHHISQRDNMRRNGTPRLVVTGTVTRIGYTANTTQPTVEVLWDGPEGGLNLHSPNLLALALS